MCLNVRNYITLYIFLNFLMKHIGEPLYLGKNALCSYITITHLHFLWYHKRRLILSNDNEINPGPKIPLKISQYVIGTWIVSQRIFFQK